ncbi:hypothetical protein GUJ93_ZPchr0012g20902 [Zizania palustris]|uniref:UBC core domain-containing protein n=1 Tax=Zizania palustris TaxID=103762 RepID=A0A8J5WQ85_ZIZPA|nr:hypothetical protein GUJ93_ZPchr0012g20902 [Zizania palustris]
MQSNPSPDFMALPLEEDIFEWKFAILGSRDSEFEGGIYHGRIQLPSDYPFKPPSFMLLPVNNCHVIIFVLVHHAIYEILLNLALSIYLRAAAEWKV